jgi:hypothetical protein
MGLTIPSFRDSAEIEIAKWNLFRRELDEKERKIFDEMMSYSRMHNAAGLLDYKPMLLQPILMSIIFEHYKELRQIETTIRRELP